MNWQELLAFHFNTYNRFSSEFRSEPHYFRVFRDGYNRFNLGIHVENYGWFDMDDLTLKEVLKTINNLENIRPDKLHIEFGIDISDDYSDDINIDDIDLDE